MSDDDSELWSRMTEIFREVFEDDALEIAGTTTADDVEDWDSLTHIELLVAIERAFDVRFNTGEVAGLKNVGEMVALVTRRVTESGASS